MIYFKLKSSQRARVMDKTAARLVLIATSVLLVTVLACIGFFLTNPAAYITHVYYIAIVVVVALITFVYLMNNAIIGAVYRHRDDKNKEIYEQYKIYFDKKFVKLKVPDGKYRKNKDTE